jgi:hypothetical protein
MAGISASDRTTITRSACCCSGCGVGGRQAAVDRGGGGGAAAGHGGARQDPLHRALPHRRLLLGGQGNFACLHTVYAPFIQHQFWTSRTQWLILLVEPDPLCRGKRQCSRGSWATKPEGKSCWPLCFSSFIYLVH